MPAARWLPLLLAGALPAQGKVDFQRQILPILEQRCLECHAAPRPGPDGRLQRPKGGVAFDSKDGMLAKKGVIVAKDARASSLWQLVTLPADDDDRMPPRSKGAPLTTAQTDLIKQWIDEGASFGAWTGRKAEGPPPAAATSGKSPGRTADAYARLAAGLKPLPAALLQGFATGPFLVQSVGDGSPLLAVSCRGSADTIDDAALVALEPIAGHVAELDLSRTRVGDEGMKRVAAMPRLVVLDLRQSAVGNHGIAALGACKELQVLNLFGTKAGDYGITALSGLKNLRELYVWQTDVSAAAAVRLRESIPELRVVMGPALPEPLPQGTGAPRRRR
jgi:hypothetical protein